MTLRKSFKISTIIFSISLFISEGCQNHEDPSSTLQAARKWMSEADPLSHRHLQEFWKNSKLRENAVRSPAGSNREPQYSPNEVIIRFRPTSPKSKSSIGFQAQSFKSTPGVEGVEILSPKQRTAKLQLKENSNILMTIDDLKNRPDIEWAQPNYQYHALELSERIPNDPQFFQLWGLKNTGQKIIAAGKDRPFNNSNPGIAGIDMRLPQAWMIRTDCSNVQVALLDSGVISQHEDLQGNI